MSDTFKCEVCHQTYQKGWTDEEAIAEYDEKYGEKYGPCRENMGQNAVVCSNCVPIIDAYVAGASQEQLMQLLRKRFSN